MRRINRALLFGGLIAGAFGGIGCSGGSGASQQSVVLDTTDGKFDDADKNGLHIDLSVLGASTTGTVDTVGDPLPVELLGVADIKLSYSFGDGDNVGIDQVVTQNGQTITLVSGNWAIHREGKAPITFGAVWTAHASQGTEGIDINGIDPSQKLVLSADIPLGDKWDFMPEYRKLSDGSSEYMATFTWHIK